MEDAQPNEFRLARKGATSVPHVSVSRPPYAPYRRPPYSHPHGRRWRPSPTRAPPPSAPNDKPEDVVGHELVRVDVHLPPGCCKGEPGYRNARKSWIEDHKRYLQAHRHHSVVSFRYLDDRRVQFTCRIRQASQSAGHDAKATTSRNAQLDTERGNTTRQGAMAPSMIRVRDNYSDLAQSRVPRPGHTGLTPPALTGSGDRPQRVEEHPFVDRKLAKSTTIKMKFHPVQTPHIDPLPRCRPTSRITTPITRTIIDLSLDPPSPAVEERSNRWSTFRSGYMSVCLPSLSSDSRTSSSETSTNPQPSISQIPEQAMVQPEDVPVNHVNSHPILENLRANDVVPVCPTKDRPTSESLADPLHQRDAPEMARSGYSHDRSPLPEGEHPSLPDYTPASRSFTSACGILPLPLGPHDRPRRLLYDNDFTYVVTAHGVIERVNPANALKSDCTIRLPPLPFQESVDDACTLFYQGNSVIILGHAREPDQISLLNLEHGQAFRHMALRRDWNTAKRFGVSAVTSLMSPLKFASGGYDHRVHIWDIAQDLSGASAVELAIKHTSLVHSLLPILDTSHKLVSVGADRDIPIYDMSAERVVRTLKVSSTPYHAHKTDTVSCTLLEVSHLETQFEVRDHRTPIQAAERFGFIADETRGRYDKACTWSHYVACGDKNGAVHLWDLRNVSREVFIRQCFNDPAMHVVHTGLRLLACSRRNELAYVDFQGG